MYIYYDELNKIVIASPDSLDFAKEKYREEITCEEIVRVNGQLYTKSTAPLPPAPTREEIRQLRESAYERDVDPITAHIERLRDDEPQSDEIEALILERREKVAEIKQLYPYPDEL